MRFDRAAGILLHPTSLPGKFAIGDIGPEAFAFCDRLADAGQSYWQILPLGPTGYGDSPYQSLSAFAGNTLLISPEKLVEDGLVEESVLEAGTDPEGGRVGYSRVTFWKDGLFRTAFDVFEHRSDLHPEFEHFCGEEGHWLDEYALYRAIKSSRSEGAWFQWPEGLKLRQDAAIERAHHDLNPDIRFHKFLQFIFYRQWRDLHQHATSRGIRIIGDIPIFVALDSADVWTNRAQFKLETDGSPRVVAGVPPDFFSETGQLWGNPICDWDAMRQDGFAWWLARFSHALRTVDVVRIDHFRGFVGTWEVPGHDETAEHGQWVSVPGEELFTTLCENLGDMPVIAEDLGAITPEVNALRDEFGFPGMRILQYGFGGDAFNRDLPHNYDRQTVAYTGTHDNDTIIGWFGALDANTRQHVIQYLAADEGDIHWPMIRSLFNSVADTVIIPMQDIFGLGNEARMNTPATTDGNWQWRMAEGAFSDDIVKRLRELSELYGRCH